MSQQQIVVVQVRPSRGVAGVLSFFVPGLGQLYKGQLLKAAIFFVIVPIGYLCLIVPGIILHLLCIFEALG